MTGILRTAFSVFLFFLLLFLLSIHVPAWAEPFLEGTYDLYPNNDRSHRVTSMTIYNQKGSEFRVRGDDQDWGGSGHVSGAGGYYDWLFLDGKSGRTTFTIHGNGNLEGHVQGSGIDWIYIAVPRSRPVRVEPKSCKSCFAEEKAANDGCTGTSTDKIQCYNRNRAIREKCQESCVLP